MEKMRKKEKLLARRFLYSASVLFFIPFHPSLLKWPCKNSFPSKWAELSSTWRTPLKKVFFALFLLFISLNCTRRVEKRKKEAHFSLYTTPMNTVKSNNKHHYLPLKKKTHLCMSLDGYSLFSVIMTLLRNSQWEVSYPRNDNSQRLCLRGENKRIDVIVFSRCLMCYEGNDDLGRRWYIWKP